MRRNEIMEKIKNELFDLRDESYYNFHKKLIPNIPEERIIGIRTPALRSYAKKLAKQPIAYEFLKELPHTYYEENNLHGTLLSLLYKDIESYLIELEKFLPYIDNWATCDMMSPKVFQKNLPLVYEYVKKWIASSDTYTIRFGVVTLLGYFLGESFEVEMLDLVSEIDSEEYYVKMAVAWYFSMALVKQYEAAIPYLEKRRLPDWVHNKTIQKAIESRQIDEKIKAYLKTLKIK